MELASPWLIWLITGVILFIVEMVFPGFVFFFFGLAAWLTALGSFLFSWSLNSQLACFLISALVSLLFLRSFIKKVFLGDKNLDNEDKRQARGGEKCLVTMAIIPPAEGQIKFGGSFWRAEADEEIREGETATIVSQSNLLIKVQKSS